MKAKGFLIYYLADPDSRTVYILNYVYEKRDQLQALIHMQIDTQRR